MFSTDILVNADDSTIQVLDSLKVNESWIYEVFFDTLYYIYNQPFPQDLLFYPNKCYYSTSLGVVRIDFSDGSSWELEEIIWK
jgi:hypothetical protein